MIINIIGIALCINNPYDGDYIFNFSLNLCTKFQLIN